ncbi:MAG: hypothetical protein ABI333_22830 [bacterium]
MVVAKHHRGTGPLGDSDTDGFFSLETFDNQVTAGQFGYGHEGQSMLYRHPARGLLTTGLLGISESVSATVGP